MYREAGIDVTGYPVEKINVEDSKITVAPGGFFREVLGRLLRIV